MAGNKVKNSDQPQLPEEGQDVEGHNLWMNPSASREMTNSRSRDLEREARDRQRAKEAKGDKR
jgi:redox-sensitive bicupin YhaK (pirin superfamily)